MDVATSIACLLTGVGLGWWLRGIALSRSRREAFSRMAAPVRAKLIGMREANRADFIKPQPKPEELDAIELALPKEQRVAFVAAMAKIRDAAPHSRSRGVTDKDYERGDPAAYQAAINEALAILQSRS